MSNTEKTVAERADKRLALVPRMKGQGYTEEDVSARRAWVEQRTDVVFHHVAAGTIASNTMRGNIENPIGIVQMPLGVAGPLRVNGEHAKGEYYVPLATTEGALVRSYERGMVVLARAGGVTARIHRDENRITPVFFFEDVALAADFARDIGKDLVAIREQAESTTYHGKLLELVPHVVGREVMLTFHYNTGDAQGMNMIVKATHKACEWIKRQSSASRYHIFSGMSSEKRASTQLLMGGKGKKVTAGCLIPAKIVRTYLHSTPRQFLDLWQHTVLGNIQAGAINYNGHMANGLTALFIATGQDVANVVNAAMGTTNFEETPEGDLYASVTVPALTLATVGGGVALGSSRECLDMIGCFGSGKARKFAEIVAGTLLAGELSFGASIASGEFVNAHETYGRNRPEEEGS